MVLLRHSFPLTQSQLYHWPHELNMSWTLPGAAFIHVPKTGGLSIGHLLNGEPLAKVHTHHMTAVQLRAITPDWDERFKFVFVRNPWARVASMYAMITKDSSRGWKSKFSKFEGFIVKPYGNSSYATNFHLTQLEFISDGDKIIVDHVARFENLVDEWKLIATKLNLPTELPHRNPGANLDYHQFYTDETREYVGQKYAREIEVFGYEF